MVLIGFYLFIGAIATALVAVKEKAFTNREDFLVDIVCGFFLTIFWPLVLILYLYEKGEGR
jgi:hypothetical protein